MDLSQLPNVDDVLVTADNPARTDLLGMDHVRCAALHNYLVHYAWIAEGRPSASLHDNISTFFTAHGSEAEALYLRLDPSVAAFLSTALLPPVEFPWTEPFFFWASGLASPRDLFDNGTADLYDMPLDTLLCLYHPNIGQGGEAGGGVYYHHGRHRATVFMNMDDWDFSLPIAAHPEHWHPLETVLSNWISMLHLGKIMASPTDAPSLFGVEKIGPWEWRPYSEAQVVTCLAAWDRLCGSVDARIATISTNASTEPEPESGPLVTPTVLDAASVPDPSFARAFLTRARRPQFRHIAPGLLLPPQDAVSFRAAQPFTRLPRGPHSIPPVCLFSTDRVERKADLTGAANPFFCDEFRARSADSPVPTCVRAGVYSDSVQRDCFDNAEEGFRLLLPYAFGENCWDESAGARTSDGSHIESTGMAQLFQHGFKPFGGDYVHAQRLERLFDSWRELIDRGVWSVGPQGVEGSIDTFREADTAAHFRDYMIPPSW